MIRKMWYEAVVANLSNISEFAKGNICVGSEALRTVTIKGRAFWDKTQRSPFGVSREYFASIIRFEE